MQPYSYMTSFDMAHIIWTILYYELKHNGLLVKTLFDLGTGLYWMSFVSNLMRIFQIVRLINVNEFMIKDGWSWICVKRFHFPSEWFLIIYFKSLHLKKNLFIQFLENFGTSKAQKHIQADAMLRSSFSENALYDSPPAGLPRFGFSRICR